MSTRQYKNLKGLKKENLRDNMTTLELVLNVLAEANTTEIYKQREPETFAVLLVISNRHDQLSPVLLRRLPLLLPELLGKVAEVLNADGI